MRRLSALAVLLAALAAVIVVGFVDKRGAGPPKPAPALPSTALRPPAVTLAQLRGHPALINFWASWCHPCVKEAPQLQRFAAQEHGLQLVSVDTGDNASDARSFIRRYGWTFPVLRDPNNTVGDRYGIAGLPTTFVLNGRGQIVARLVGPQTSAELERALRSAE
jgi:cytochrome c biogenesis protein CcmG, thiol:disulfide interchange protein DsbE